MELIFDSGYEDWGDCKGRAWCATCHVKVSNPDLLNPLEVDEQSRLSQLSNKLADSRLACQIPLSKNIQNMKFEFIGDDQVNGLTVASHVIAVNFQTIAAANDYWKQKKTFRPNYL